MFTCRPHMICSSTTWLATCTYTWVDLLIQEMLTSECHMAIALVLPGTTSLMQPLDVSVDAKFIVEWLQNNCMPTNVSLYMEHNISASKSHIHISKWVGETCTGVCSKDRLLLCIWEMWHFSSHSKSRGWSPTYQVDPDQQEKMRFELASDSD